MRILRCESIGDRQGRRGLTLRMVVALTLLLPIGVLARAEEISLPGLQAAVEVYLDGHGIPHVYASSWVDAARVMGYVHASDRLWQMDMLRRQASGRLAEIIGPDGLPSDTLMRQLGIRRSCEQQWQTGDIPPAMRAELEAYAEGVNHKIAQLGAKRLPLAFQVLEYQPEPWSPVDCLVFSKYMGWDQSGTLDDLWLGSVIEKLGPSALEELWPIDRPYEQPTVTVQADRGRLEVAPQARRAASATEPLAVALPVESESNSPASSAVSRITAEPLARMRESTPDLARTYGELYGRLSRAGWFSRGFSFGSNNWAVDGTKTASGKPMLCSDPHLGFTIPSIWYTAHLCVAGENVAGVTFPGAPTVVIGHNDFIAWGITNMQADAVDYYVETLDEHDPPRYLHQGQWKEVERIVEQIPVRGGEPQELIIDSTLHGPLVHRQPAAISLCWTGLGPTTDSIAFWEISRARNIQQFLAGLDKLEVPALNMVYADIHGNIAMHCCGRLPVRTRGQGRVPMEGASGDHDWQGWIPRAELPLAVNPPEHFVASANGRPHPLGYPHYLGWMWDPSYRTRRIKQLLAGASDLTIESMKPIQLDHYDEAASRFLPIMLQAMERPLEGESDSAELKAALEAVRAWDYVASRESLGPAIWLRWLEKYRDRVWGDDWEFFQIEPQDGSWGFTGENRREPMLEVLEFLTREMPDSPWFNDRRTAERENRDSLIRHSFVDAVASLQSQFGPDMTAWTWKHINILKIDSLTGDARLARQGGPVVGSAFTLNPGSNVGPVGGGASWRMIVDFGDPSGSIGVYPGGQSENPFSGQYADQIPLWAAGQYAPLHMLGSPDQLPASAKKKLLKFQ